LIHDILGLTDKSIIPGHCGIPLDNLQSAESVDVVPASIVPEDPWFIADLNNQSTIFMLNKVEQE
jgi:hypothetical protein